MRDLLPTLQISLGSIQRCKHFQLEYNSSRSAYYQPSVCPLVERTVQHNATPTGQTTQSVDCIRETDDVYSSSAKIRCFWYFLILNQAAVFVSHNLF